jgi:hypothetical protein
MASTWTDNNGIEKIADGEKTDTWGQITNRNLDILDRATNGVGSIDLSSAAAAYTLTTSDGTVGDAIDEGNYKAIVFTGATEDCTITISPNDAEKVYLIKNSSGYQITIQQGDGTGGTVAIPDTYIDWVFADGAGTGAAVTSMKANIDYPVTSGITKTSDAVVADEIMRFDTSTGDQAEGAGITASGTTGVKFETTSTTYPNTAILADNSHVRIGRDNKQQFMDTVVIGRLNANNWTNHGNKAAVIIGQSNFENGETSGTSLNSTSGTIPRVMIGNRNLYFRDLGTTTTLSTNAQVLIGEQNGQVWEGGYNATFEIGSTNAIGYGNCQVRSSGDVSYEINNILGGSNLVSGSGGSTHAVQNYLNNIVGNNAFDLFGASGGTLEGNFNNILGNNAFRFLNKNGNAVANYNTVVGDNAMYFGGSPAAGTTNNNTAIGQYAGTSTSPSGALVGNSNRICLGNNNITNAYIKVSWTVTSDERDKADRSNLTLGLNEVNQMNPISYKWDMRSDYFVFDDDGNITSKPTPDGTHKESQVNIGFSAQELRTIFEAAGAPANSIVNTEDDENLKVKESALIPVLVNAIKELSTKCDSLQAQIDAMGA